MASVGSFEDQEVKQVGLDVVDVVYKRGRGRGGKGRIVASTDAEAEQGFPPTRLRDDRAIESFELPPGLGGPSELGLNDNTGRIPVVDEEKIWLAIAAFTAMHVAIGEPRGSHRSPMAIASRKKFSHSSLISNSCFLRRAASSSSSCMRLLLCL